MKKLLVTSLIITLSYLTTTAQNFRLFSNSGKAQTTQYIYGVRAGINIANVSNSGTLRTTPKVGFMAGAYADGSSGKLIGMRQEITYSRQGFHFNKSGRRGTVDVQYVLLGNLATINLGNIFQFHLGPQAGFLINALADTVRNISSSEVTRFFSIKGQSNRLTYGGCAGAEVYPYKGLLIGVRYNLSISSLNKKELKQSYVPSNNNNYVTVNDRNDKPQSLRNVVWQFVVGWRF